MTPAFLLVAVLSKQPARVTPLRPGEWREIGVAVEGPTRADWGRRWGAFGAPVARGGFGRLGRGAGSHRSRR